MLAREEFKASRLAAPSTRPNAALMRTRTAVRGPRTVRSASRCLHRSQTGRWVARAAAGGMRVLCSLSREGFFLCGNQPDLVLL